MSCLGVRVVPDLGFVAHRACTIAGGSHEQRREEQGAESREEKESKSGFLLPSLRQRECARFSSRVTIAFGFAFRPTALG